MKYIRAELHNHSTESDGRLSVKELVDYAAGKNFGVLALTDHNTVSGHAAAQAAIRDGGYDLCLLPGIEVTTFYGHILALGTSQMPDFRDLNPRMPEAFMEKLHQYARAVGIAHPYAVGEPLYVGCRFEMRMHDWDCVDYIEVVNTSVEEALGDAADTPYSRMTEALIGNASALRLWEDLVLSGHRLAAVTGKDIHSMPKDAEVFTTYAAVEDDNTLNPADAVIGAILSQKTVVTKGPLFSSRVTGRDIEIAFDNSSGYLGWTPEKAAGVHRPMLEVRFDNGEVRQEKTGLEGECRLPWSENARRAVVKLYDDVCDYGHLLAVGAPVYAREGGEPGPAYGPGYRRECGKPCPACG